MSINAFKSLVTASGGFARPNKFAIELPTIPGSTLTNRDLNILCRTAVLPAKQVSTIERRIGMENEKIGYGYVTDDVTFSFLMLNDYKVKRYFDAWRKLIIDEEAQTVGYKSDYQQKIVIHQLGTQVPSIGASLGLKVGPISKTVTKSFAPFPQIQITKPTYSVELINAFPITTAEVAFANELDGLIEMTVQVAYTNWREIESSQQTINIDLPGGFQFEATN